MDCIACGHHHEIRPQCLEAVRAWVAAHRDQTNYTYEDAYEFAALMRPDNQPLL